MPVVKVKNLHNDDVGEISLSDKVFGVDLNNGLIYEAVKEYRARGRAGTSSTKTRGDVSGSGRKLWKQKGTGRARIASLRSPLWKGGGSAHGPQPRDWGYSIPRKMRQGAICSALSERLREGNLIVVKDLVLDGHKTRDFLSVLRTLGLDSNMVLAVDSFDNNNLVLASRNIRHVKNTNGYGVNIYDVLNHEKIIISQEAIVDIEKILNPEK